MNSWTRRGIGFVITFGGATVLVLNGDVLCPPGLDPGDPNGSSSTTIAVTEGSVSVTGSPSTSSGDVTGIGTTATASAASETSAESGTTVAATSTTSEGTTLADASTSSSSTSSTADTTSTAGTSTGTGTDSTTGSSPDLPPEVLPDLPPPATDLPSPRLDLPLPDLPPTIPIEIRGTGINLDHPNPAMPSWIGGLSDVAHVAYISYSSSATSTVTVDSNGYPATFSGTNPWAQWNVLQLGNAVGTLVPVVFPPEDALWDVSWDGPGPVGVARGATIVAGSSAPGTFTAAVTTSPLFRATGPVTGLRITPHVWVCEPGTEFPEPGTCEGGEPRRLLRDAVSDDPRAYRFRPRLIERFIEANIVSFRPMETLAINTTLAGFGGQAPTWAARTHLEQALWPAGGFPYEVFVDLARAMERAGHPVQFMWLNLPHVPNYDTSDYATQLAELIAADPVDGVQWVFGRSNEPWDTNPVRAAASGQLLAWYGESITDPTMASEVVSGRQSASMCAAIKAVLPDALCTLEVHFYPNTSALTRTLAGMTAQQQALIDIFAIAPYYGNRGGDIPATPTLTADYLLGRLTSDVDTPWTTMVGAIPLLYAYSGDAVARGKRLWTYEDGCHWLVNEDESDPVSAVAVIHQVAGIGNDFVFGENQRYWAQMRDSGVQQQFHYSFGRVPDPRTDGGAWGHGIDQTTAWAPCPERVRCRAMHDFLW